MADHQSTTASRTTQNNARPRLGDFSITGRSPPSSMTLEDITNTQNPSLGPGLSRGIWGGGIPSITTMKAGNEESSYLSSSAFEQVQGSSSRIHTEYDRWSSKPAVNWPEDPSSALANVSLNDTISRSPVRLHGNQHDLSQTATDIPRSSSPYTSFTRQLPVGQPPIAQSPPNNSNRGFFDNSGSFSATIGGGVLSHTFGNNRLTSDSSYTPYQSLPGQQSTSHASIHAAPFVPTFPTARPNYHELGLETIEAEVLAAKFGIETDDQDRFTTGHRRNKPAPFPQSTTNNSGLPSNFRNQFGDPSPFPRQPIPGITQGQKFWGGTADASYGSETYLNDGGFQEGTKNNPYYAGDNTNTPTPGMDLLRPSSRSGLPVQSHQQGHLGPPQLLLQRDQGFPRSAYGLPYQYPPPPFNGGLRMPVDSHFSNSTLAPLISNQQPRRHDDSFTHSLRSVLLEEFRSNSKSNKRYELKDIYTHVVEFSGDQHGSRFIQQKLETANSDEKEIVFNEIRTNCLQLMTDVFGNYVIQKFFEHGNQVQKSILAKEMQGHVLTLSLQMYGCRVVQKALEHILVDQQAALVKELDGHVLKCVKDQNGNHVVQKAIERVPAEHIQFIIKAFTGQVHNLATHPYGCRVIQRMLEHCDETAQASLLAELHVCTYTLVQDQYGNYVTQHVIEHGKPEDRAKIIQLVTTQLLHFSKHKFASNVVEKSIAHGTDEQRREIVKVITTARQDGSSPLQVLMRDQYGNYVIQKLLMQLKDKDREILVDQIKPQLQQLKKYHYGKQINAIEKLIYNSSPSQSQSTTPPPTTKSNTPPPTKPANQAAKSSTTAVTPSKAHSKENAAKTVGKQDGSSV